MVEQEESRMSLLQTPAEVRVPTTEELGEAMLNAAAVGNRSKLKKLLDTGLCLIVHTQSATDHTRIGLPYTTLYTDCRLT